MLRDPVNELGEGEWSDEWLSSNNLADLPPQPIAFYQSPGTEAEGAAEVSTVGCRTTVLC